MNKDKICDYGCGQKATHQFKNGKWCCSINHIMCSFQSKKNLRNKGKHHTEETKKKISEKTKGYKHTYKAKLKMSKSRKGREPWNKAKIGVYSKEVLELMSKVQKDNMSDNKRKVISIKSKLSIINIKEKYPTFSKTEEMRYEPGKEREKIIQVHCKNHNCINSKEQDGWFTPIGEQLHRRIYAIEKQDGNDGRYFYCSNKCKEECPLYNKKVSQLIKEDQIKAGIIKEEYYTYGEYQTFREEVLERAEHLCEYCGERAEHVHHIRPQKLDPFFSLYPDFGLSCCRKCHYKYGHKDECSSGQLSNVICRR